MNNDISLIVLNYNDFETTEKYIDVVKKYQIISHIIVVDNCSTDNSYKYLKCKYSSNKVDVIRSEYNGGYGYGNNYGINYSIKKYNSKYLLISNPDVKVMESVIKSLHMFLEKYTTFSLVSPIMKSIDGNIEYNCAWEIPTGWNYAFREIPIFHFIFKSTSYNHKYYEKDKFCKVEAVAGSFFMIRTSTMYDIGGYDEDIFLYCEENVLGIKLKKKNYMAAILTNEFFIHEHSVSIRKTIKNIEDIRKILWKSKKIVLRKYYDFGNSKMLVIKLLELFDMFSRKIYYRIRNMV